MAVHKNNHLLLTQHDVIRYQGKIYAVAGASADKSSADRKFPDLYVRLTEVKADGTLGDTKDYGREDVLKTAQYIDGAEVITRVVLPDDIRQQLAEYEANQRKEDETFERRDELTDEEIEHPSFGAIQLHKYSGHAKLFMSPFHHQHFIGISIHRAYMKRSLAEDHMFSSGRAIAEVFLSEAQFARFLTGSDGGNGTPCTLHHVTGTYFPEPPYKDEKEKFADDTKKTLKAAAAFLESAEAQLRILFDKKTLSKADKEKIADLVHTTRRRLDDSLPFIHSQMQERMDKLVTNAGIEVDAMIGRITSNLGLKALTGMEPPIKFLDTSAKPQLPRGTGYCNVCHDRLSTASRRGNHHAIDCAMYDTNTIS